MTIHQLATYIRLIGQSPIERLEADMQKVFHAECWRLQAEGWKKDAKVLLGEHECFLLGRPEIDEDGVTVVSFVRNGVMHWSIPIGNVVLA